MHSKFDSILFIGFGGPEKPEDILPFLRNVTRGRNIPDARLQNVAHHYEKIGGRSPYNQLTFKQVDEFKKIALKNGLNLPVYLGLRNWNPYLKATLFQMKRDGVKNAIGFILAPHRSYSSYNQYLENVETAKTQAGFESLQVSYVDPWHEHPLLIEAVADRVKEKLNDLNEGNENDTLIIFTAHSIPVSMAEQSCYREEIETSSRKTAELLGRKKWIVAYQSRSGRPGDPWLEPDICDIFPHSIQHGVKNIIAVPIGFLSDHAEVLYDLDIEAKKEAEKFNLNFLRAQTVMDHPKFIEMIYEMISQKYGSKNMIGTKFQ